MTEDQKLTALFNYDIHLQYGNDLTDQGRKSSTPTNYSAQTRFEPFRAIYSILNQSITLGGSIGLDVGSIGVDVSNIHLSSSSNDVYGIYKNIVQNNVKNRIITTNRELIKSIGVCVIGKIQEDLLLMILPYQMSSLFRPFSKDIDSFITSYQWDAKFSDNGFSVPYWGIGAIPEEGSIKYLSNLIDFLSQTSTLSTPTSHDFKTIYYSTRLGQLYHDILSNSDVHIPNDELPEGVEWYFNIFQLNDSELKLSIPAIKLGTDIDLSSLSFNPPSTFQQGLINSMYLGCKSPMIWFIREDDLAKLPSTNWLDDDYYGETIPSVRDLHDNRLKERQRRALSEAMDTCIVEIKGGANNRLNDQSTSFTAVFANTLNSDSVIIGTKRLGMQNNPQLFDSSTIRSNLILRVGIQNKHGDSYGVGNREQWMTIRLTAFNESLSNIQN